MFPCRSWEALGKIQRWPLEVLQGKIQGDFLKKALTTEAIFTNQGLNFMKFHVAFFFCVSILSNFS